MRLTRLKKLLLALLLMVFTGQSIAASVARCPMQQAESSTPHSMMAGMDHSMMDMQAMDQAMLESHAQHSKKADCCKQLGHCLQGGCSVIGLDTHMLVPLPISTSAAAYFYHRAQPLRVASSLFRPPIFR
jgi:membrane protease subunit (stomatin/prohibitin family)